MSVPVDVAAAVLIRADGAALLAQRPGDKVYSGYWEFPGGKIEPGERVAEALGREIREELGVEIERAYPWITRVFTYPHAKVRLHFHRVYAWRGEPRALEHQALVWQRPEAITVDPLLPANGPVLRGLLLPAEYAITRAAELGVEPFLSRLEARLRGGLKLVQVREKVLARPAAEAFARRIVALARAHDAKVLVNADAALAREIGADGVHLTAEQLCSVPGPIFRGAAPRAIRARNCAAPRFLGSISSCSGRSTQRLRTRMRSRSAGNDSGRSPQAQRCRFTRSAGSCRAIWSKP
jgi:8-oxo-dGTP diphosphatase